MVTSNDVPATFEQKLARIDAIVTELEGQVDLAKAVELFKEGKNLVRECEALLKGAQDALDRAMNDESR